LSSLFPFSARLYLLAISYNLFYSSLEFLIIFYPPEKSTFLELIVFLGSAASS